MRIKFDIKKTWGGWNYKKNQFKKWSQMKKIAIKRMMTKFERWKK